MLPSWVYSKKLTHNKQIKKILGIKFSCLRAEKTIAFLELRGLGDYILMHNFLKYVKESKKYKDWNIILITKRNFASLIEAYDSMYVDEVLYIDSRNADKVLNGVRVEELVCIYPQMLKLENDYFKKISAKRKIVHNSSFRNRYINITTQHINMFHRERVHKFFEQLIEEQINYCKNPYFDIEFDNICCEKCIFISPFAYAQERCWDIQKYIYLIKKIGFEYKNNIVILGETSLRNTVQYMIDNCSELKNRLINGAGMFSVYGLYQALKEKSLILIANETGTVHLSAAANIPVVCISNGSHYGIYQPYDKKNIKYIYPKDFDYKYTSISLLDINNISVDEVFATVKNMINNQLFI